MPQDSLPHTNRSSLRDHISLRLPALSRTGYPGAMKFASPLISGTLVQRYKRFLSDVRLDGGETITTTCPNTGAMLGLTTPGARVWISTSNSPTRKYKHTWELIETDLGNGPTLVGINSGHPNAIVSEAIAAGKIASLKGFASQRREVKYGANSRIDVLLEGGPGGGCCYVEVKNVHLMRTAGIAEFPDSRTERGVKHLQELSKMVAAGHRAVMVYLVQRSDATTFDIARDIDPAYAAAFALARAAGVEMLAYRCRLTPEDIVLDQAVTFADGH